MNTQAAERIATMLATLPEKPHGERVRYMQGCRCMLCRAANSRYETERAALRRIGQGNGLVPADRARRHVEKLSRAGVRRRSVAAAAGVAASIIADIRKGERTQIRRDTERRILAVDAGAVAGKGLVDAGPTWRLIDQMVADGYTKYQIARWAQKYHAALLGTWTANRARQASRYTLPLAAYCEAAGVRYIQQLTLQHLEAFRQGWTGGPVTAIKRIDRLRAFCAWCVAHGWLKENPAKQLRPPAERPAPTMPYTRAEFRALLSACEIPTRSGESRAARDNRARLRALLLVLRYTGLRISDALRLGPESVRAGRIQVQMAKTGHPVSVPVQPWLLADLETVPARPGGRWWWDGAAGIDCTAEILRRQLKRIAGVAGVADPGWHRFRDTFAVELLVGGVPLERVSMLLGHQSILITERHYAPWVPARQAQLEADVMAAWGRDPVAQQLELRAAPVEGRQQ